jgi:hypothetical protein
MNIVAYAASCCSESNRPRGTTKASRLLQGHRCWLESRQTFLGQARAPSWASVRPLHGLRGREAAKLPGKGRRPYTPRLEDPICHCCPEWRPRRDLIYKKNKNRFRNENGQPNCFLSVGPVEISGAFAAETVCQQHTRGREIEYGGLSRCGARSRGIGASEKRSERTAYLATGFSRRTQCMD